MKNSLSIACCLLFLFFSSCNTAPKTHLSSTKSAVYKNAAVVTAHPEASKIGIEIIKAGGNAIDAAIAVQFALAVSYPVAGNIGGGGFMVYRSNKGEFATLDYREMAPMAAYEKMYQDADGNVNTKLSTQGHLASGVPGSVDGMYTAFKKYSKLKNWKMLIQPSINLARKGFYITQSEVDRLNKYRPAFVESNTASNSFVKKNPWKVNDKMKQEDLAQTLERIRDQGRDGFYKGITAELIVAEMNRANGIITKEDLANYTSKWREPIICEFEDLKIISMPPPSSGGIALCQLLAMVEPYNIKQYGFQSPEAIHLMVEAERRAYADRTKHLGDADYYPVPQEKLLDADYLTNRMNDFSQTQKSNSNDINGGDAQKESEQTTHFSIVDAEGNAVSITTTLNTHYGCKVVVGRAGFFMNNEMDDFSAKPGEPNYYGLLGTEANKIEAGKRMLSSMTPTIVEENNELKLVVGSPGGSTIITSVYQVILNSLVFDMSIAAAVHEERFHSQWKPDVIYVETNAFDKKTTQQLEQLGHVLEDRSSIGRVEAIMVTDSKELDAVADWRGDDDARGY